MKTDRKNALKTYLTLTAGAGCAATIAEGAVNAYVFAPGTVNDSSDSPYLPAGIDIGLSPSNFGRLEKGASLVSYFGYQFGGAPNGYLYFTTGANLALDGGSPTGSYSDGGTTYNGAVVDGVTKNYSYISFGPYDGVFEAIGEFVFDGAGGGYMTGFAIDTDGNSLSIAAGKAAIEAITAVPEPSYSLALLALGSAGVLTLRNRKAAA